MPLVAAALLQIAATASPLEARLDPVYVRAPFADLRHLLPALEGVRARITLADLTGDGAPEAIGEFGVLYNDGDGGFGAADRWNATFGVAFDLWWLTGGGPGYVLSEHVAAGDLDGDGDVDAFIGPFPFLGDGQGRLRQQPPPLPISFVNALVLADLDGDGDLDAALGSGSTSYVLRNDGAATFVDAGAVLPAGPASELVVLDVERDGDVDLVRDGRLLRNDGSGAFAADAAAIPLAAQRGFQAGDADGDGFPELFVAPPNLAGQGLEPVILLRNLGGLAFEDLGTLPATSGRGVETFSLADFDQDGDLDLLSVRPGLLLANDGAGAFLDASAGLPPDLVSSPPASQVVGDVDRDGDLDVLASAPGSVPRPRLWLGDGSGAFLEAERHVPPESFRPLVLADVDGDGDRDVVGTPRNGEPMLRRNDGTGVLARAPEPFAAAPLPLAPADAVAGDVDGDADVDLVWAQPGQDRLHVNHGAQGFADESAARLPLEARHTRGLELADLDADGDLDLLLANGTSSTTSSLWLNDGAGFFGDASGLLPQRYEITQAYAVGDVDQDGRLDVYGANFGQNVLLLGDPGLVLRDATDRLPVVAPEKISYDVVLADLDGDGDLDAYTSSARYLGATPGSYEGGGHYPDSDELLLNEGGTFVHHPELQSTSAVGYALALGDYDEDGDVDVLVGGAEYRTGCCLHQDGEASYYANRGDGHLLRSDWTGKNETELLVGDLDGDLDLDVVAPERVLTNTTRALAWGTLPRAGRRLSFDLFGPSGEPYLLLSASASVSLPTDLGLLRLDPGALLFSRAGPLGSLGHSRSNLAVPAERLGATLYWQALVGSPARLTNLEPTTFTGF